MKKVVGFCVLSAMVVNFVAAGTAQASSSVFRAEEKKSLARTGSPQPLSSHAERERRERLERERQQRLERERRERLERERRERERREQQQHGRRR
ncbi:MAG: hypothetical protein LBD04_09360 [Synergistaceae bacterium]|nr:hypothetical protein [Synergistaceae bacterium]